MELLRHTFPNWFVFLLMIIPIAMLVGRRLSDMGRKSQEKHEAEIERYETLKRRREERERERQEVRRLHKLGWRTADIANELKISTDRVRLDVRSEDSLEISMRGAIATSRELQDVASHAKSRLQKHGDPIVRADLEELLSMLANAQQRIDAEMDSTIAKANVSPPFNIKSTMIQIEKANSLPQTIIVISRSRPKTTEPRARKCCMS
jgi:hypothetical protein